MSEITPKKNLSTRIEQMKLLLGASARAYKIWQDDLETQANTRNYSKQVFQNTATTVGTHAHDIISIFDEMMAQITKANESARAYHEKYMDLKQSVEAASKEVKAAAPKNSKIKTAVVDSTTQE